MNDSPDRQRINARLRSEFGEHGYDHWFSRLEFERISGEALFCTVPTRFLKSWILSQFYDRLLTCVRAEIPAIKHITLEMRTAARAGAQSHAATQGNGANAAVVPVRNEPSPAAIDPTASRALPFKTGSQASAAASTADFSGSPLDPKLTFESFLTGPTNQMAFAAAMSVADKRGNEPFSYNPLCFYSAVGLGKSHLLQAIAHRATATGQRVVYLTAERFMFGFVAAMRAQNSIAYKERLRSIDILIVDDIQFLRGDSFQNEFGHTLNALIDAGKRVVVAAHCAPRDLEMLDERIKSRLSGGLCVEIESFDETLRRKLLETRIAQARQTRPDIVFPPAVIEYIVSSVKTNGRDIEGAVHRLTAHATFGNARLSVELAEAAIKDLVRTQDPKRIKIDDILKLISTHYNVSRADLLSARRTATVVKPRQIAMYLSKTLTLRSLPEIGRRFGGRDHTTVLHAVRKIEALSKSDKTLNEELELLKRRLLE